MNINIMLSALIISATFSSSMIIAEDRNHGESSQLLKYGNYSAVQIIAMGSGALALGLTGAYVGAFVGGSAGFSDAAQALPRTGSDAATVLWVFGSTGIGTVIGLAGGATGGAVLGAALANKLVDKYYQENKKPDLGQKSENNSSNK